MASITARVLLYGNDGDQVYCQVATHVAPTLQSLQGLMRLDVSGIVEIYLDERLDNVFTFDARRERPLVDPIGRPIARYWENLEN